jgi:hypothetical protein
MPRSIADQGPAFRACEEIGALLKGELQNHGASFDMRACARKLRMRRNLLMALRKKPHPELPPLSLSKGRLSKDATPLIQREGEMLAAALTRARGGGA